MPRRRLPARSANQPPRIGAALASLREARALSMDALSKRSGVSKSMLSQIERQRANPTVAVVWRLANALGVPLTQLLGSIEAGDSAAIQPVRGPSVPVMRSKDGKCELRVVSPVELAGRFEWYQLIMQPGGVLASEAHTAGTREHLTVVAGRIEVRSGNRQALGAALDTLRYPADVAHQLRNVGRSRATGLLIVEFRAP
jgi:mannose-6-phosphate isomerase-like protein (cupin superfamily)